MHEKKYLDISQEKTRKCLFPDKKTLQHPYTGYKVQTHQGIINQEDSDS